MFYWLWRPRIIFLQTSKSIDKGEKKKKSFFSAGLKINKVDRHFCWIPVGPWYGSIQEAPRVQKKRDKTLLQVQCSGSTNSTSPETVQYKIRTQINLGRKDSSGTGLGTQK